MTADDGDEEGNSGRTEAKQRDGDAGSSPGDPGASPEDPSVAASERADRGTDRFSALFTAAVGSDLALRLLVDLLLRFGPELGLAIRLADATSTAPAAIVLTGTVLQFGAVSWGIGWVALFAVAAVYVPRVVEPWDDAWPAGSLARLSLAVPFVAAGLLAEAAFRRALSTVVTVGRAPIPVPLEPATVAVVVCGTALVFGGLSLIRRPARHSRPGFVVRGLLLVGIVGVFFAEISMLNPYAELFFLGLIVYDRLGGDSVLQEPAERIVDGASTVWGQVAEVVTAVYVTAAVAIVAFAVLAARLAAPTDMFARNPLATAFLVLIGSVGLLYTYKYGERSLRRFTNRFDPDIEESPRISGFLVPSAILTCLLLDGYVFGDPTGPVGVLQLVVGVFTATAGVWPLLDDADDERDNGLEIEDISDYHLTPVAVAILVGTVGAVRPLEGLYVPTMLLSGTVLTVDLVEVAGQFVLLSAVVLVPYVPAGAYTFLATTEEVDPDVDREPSDEEMIAREKLFAAHGVTVSESDDEGADFVEGTSSESLRLYRGTARGIAAASCPWSVAVAVAIADAGGVAVPMLGPVIAALLVISLVPIVVFGSLWTAVGMAIDGWEVVLAAVLEATMYVAVSGLLAWYAVTAPFRWLIGGNSG